MPAVVRSESVAAREPPPPRPTVDATIESAPAGAEVVLGGDVLGTTPFRGRIPRSGREIRLVIRLAGYADRTIALRATAPIHERLTLARKPPPAAPPPAAPAKAAPPKAATNDRDRSVNPFD